MPPPPPNFKAEQMSNEIQKMEEVLRKDYPEGKIVLDEPLKKNGVWSLDLFLHGYYFAVAWQEDKGFGLAWKDGRVYGEGPDGVFKDSNLLLNRINELITERKSNGSS